MRQPGLYLENIKFAGDNHMAAYEFVRQYFRSFNPESEPIYNYKPFFRYLSEVALAAEGKQKEEAHIYFAKQQAWYFLKLSFSLWVRSLKDKLGLRKKAPQSLDEGF